MSVHWPTLLIQVVNFLVLFFVLAKLLFRPLREHMAARAATIAKGLDDIENGRTALREQRSALQQARQRVERAEAEALAAAEREAERRRAELVDQARAAALEERHRLLAQVEVERDRAYEELARSVAPLVARAVERLLTEIAPGTPLHEAACARLAGHLHTLEPRVGHLEIESATGDVPPDLSEAITQFVRLNGQPAGQAPWPVRRAPELIAGATVRVGDVVIDGSVRSQVRRALEMPV